VRSVRDHLDQSEEIEDAVLIRTHVSRIEIQSDQLVIELTNTKGIGSKRSRSRNMLKVSWHKTPLRRRRGILVPGSVPPQDARVIRSENRALLIASIARGRRWLNDSSSWTPGANAESIATRDGCSVRKVNMTISLAFLAPDLVKAAIEVRFHMAWELSASPTCLPNGPASTRCSGFRPNSCPFELSLWRRRSLLPGNGISWPEKNAPIRRPNTDQRSQRPSGRTRSPPIRGLCKHSQEFSANGELRGGGCTPDRTGLQLKFPANREINREFCRFRPSCRIFHAQSASEFSGLQLNFPTQRNREFLEA
jgi:hypothetical protein